MNTSKRRLVDSEESTLINGVDYKLMSSVQIYNEPKHTDKPKSCPEKPVGLLKMSEPCRSH